MDRLKRLARVAHTWVLMRRHQHELRHLGYWSQMKAWVRNREVPYRFLAEDEVRERKRSDTVFITGSGPSVARLSPEQWRRVEKDDSFGINFSFLLDTVPTFHIMEDPKGLRPLFSEVLAPRRGRLSDVVWVTAKHQLQRLIHPRFAPEMFPENPKVWAFDFPPTIELERDRPFRVEDFERAIIYRGTMSVALYLVLRLGYRRVVLLGVDLHTYDRFYDTLEEMRAFVEVAKREHHRPAVIENGFRVHPLMIPLGRKYRPYDEYLYALNDFHCRPRGIELYVGNPDNLLCPRIPCFEDW